jgi:hypothetical protein
MSDHRLVGEEVVEAEAEAEIRLEHKVRVKENLIIRINQVMNFR